MSHKWEETGHFRHLDMKGRYKSAMATEDSPKAQKVATWAPLERHGDRKSQKQSGEVATCGWPCRHPLQVAT